MAQQDAVISSYKNQPEIIANRSITLMPGFTIPAGANVDIHISNNPGANIGTNIKIDMNAIVTYTPTVAGLVNATDTTNGVNQVKVEVQTFDHLGKLKEIEQVRATPLLNNLVHLKEYDALGRITNDYLPYVTAAGSTNFQSMGYNSPGMNFYSNLDASYAISPNPQPYSSSWYETQQDALLREQSAPGLAFGLDSGHTKRFEHISMPFNVIYYRVKNNALVIDSAGTYTYNDLGGTRTADENVPVYTGPEYPTYQSSGSVMEFKNFKGQVVLRRIDLWNQSDGSFNKSFSTYYVYDDRGNLSFVLPPKVGADSGTLPTQNQLDNLCYQYKYDNENRMVAKKIPGRGWDYMVYNRQGQVVMTQDSVQRTKATPEWNIIKYDGQGRVVLTGIYAQAGSLATMQQNVYLQGIDWESRGTAGNSYTNKTFPQSWATTLSVNYYDDYDLPGGNPYPYSGSDAAKTTRGLATASQVNVLGTGNMLWSVNYYDDEGRLVKIFKQHYKSNAVNAGNYDEVTDTYNFSGQLLTTTRSHKVNGTESLKTLTEYTYDAQGRKIDTWETINTSTRTLIARNDYDELGNLFHKKLHSTNGGNSFLQTITYHYNERGWLKEAQADKFDLKLAYNSTSHSAHSHYNGNIAEQEYTGDHTGNRYFTYEYDELNRLTSSSYNNSGTGLSESVGGPGYSGYDDNGNIIVFFRNAVNSIYNNNGNQLASIIGGSLGGAFTYDGNGNELTDTRRNVTLTYNRLNLPATVSGSHSASYTYDAAGTKLQSVQDATTRQYIGGIQYTNGDIDFIQTDEGLAVRNATTGVYKYQYNLKDHLGNTRVTIDDNGSGGAEVVQEDEYYAFGLDAPKFRLTTENKYLYNGKEKQDALVDQLDYGARFYDPVIGRWTSVDPLAEVSRRWSPYNYVENNPLRHIDPDGMSVEETSESYTFTGSDMSSLYNQLTGGGDDPDKRKKKSDVKQHPDLAKTDAASNGKRPNGYQLALHAGAVLSAAKANEGFGVAPYKAGTSVNEFQAMNAKGFVRVSTENQTEIGGRWLMKASDIKGLTPQEIQAKFALPNVPTRVADAQIPNGAVLRSGIAGENIWGPGGGTQYQIMQGKVGFDNVRPLTNGVIINEFGMPIGTEQVGTTEPPIEGVEDIMP